jgi:hypothetical protein
MKIKIVLFVALAVAVFLLRTVVFDRFRSNQLSVEITGPVSVLALPAPADKPGNRVLAMINRGDTVQVTRSVITSGCIALEVRMKKGPEGYIIKGDHFVVR